MAGAQRVAFGRSDGAGGEAGESQGVELRFGELGGFGAEHIAQEALSKHRWREGVPQARGAQQGGFDLADLQRRESLAAQGGVVDPRSPVEATAAEKLGPGVGQV